MTNLEELATKIESLLEPLSEQQRVEVLYLVSTVYCLHCGCIQGKYPCQCTNDE